MKKTPKAHLDNSYLAAPTVNTASDLLDAMERSKKVFEARKARFSTLAKKELAKAEPNKALLAEIDYELSCDAKLYNLAEQLIQNTQYVEAKIQDEFDELRNWLLKEQAENIQLFKENAHFKLALRNAS